MKLGILYSGGKDSTSTVWHALKEDHEVLCLMSMLSENPDSYMFQQSQKTMLEKQAEALDLPIVFETTAGVKEEELVDLKRIMAHAKEEFGIDGIGVGAIASNYQNERVHALCEELGLKVFAPLWQADPEKYMRSIVDAGFDILMVRVAAEGLDETWLGKQLTSEDVDALVALNKKLGLHIGGEGGEFETLVLNGPIFKHGITITFETTMESECRGELKLTF